MAKRIGKPEDATPRWVDKPFTLTDRLMCRLRGNLHKPEEAFLLLTLDGEDSAENTRITSLDVLRLLCAELQDFISRMDSRGVH